MVVPPAPDRADALTGSPETGTTQETPQPDGAGTRPAGAGWRRWALLVLVVALLAAGGVLVWLAAGRTGAADEQQERRDQVMAQSEQFMLRMGTFGPDLLDEGQMPDYRERVTDVITPKFRESFEKQVVVAEQLVAQSKLERAAEVFSTGVVSLDKDSAVALVAGSFTDTYGDETGRPYPFRIQLDLVRVKGEWLVDDFSPVTAEGEGQTGVPSDQPTQQPTQQPSQQPSEQPGSGGGSGGGQ